MSNNFYENFSEFHFNEDNSFTCYALHAKDPTIILLGTSQGNVYVYHLLEEFRYVYTRREQGDF